MKHLSVVLCSLIAGCVSISSMPQSADQIDFTQHVGGHTGWAEWQDTITVRAASDMELFDAAKYALARHSFQLQHANIQRGVVIGEHGMTAFDWNIVAGIYFKQQDAGDYKVRILIEGSKDVGFLGDATGGASPQMIAASLREHLDRE